MIITEIKNGGIDISIVHDELFHLARLMDTAAHVVNDSSDWEELGTCGQELEALSAMFTAAAVATHCQAGDKAWFAREDTVPTLHKERKA